MTNSEYFDGVSKGEFIDWLVEEGKLPPFTTPAERSKLILRWLRHRRKEQQEWLLRSRKAKR